MTEGYIKYNCDWKEEPIQIPEEVFYELEIERSRLYNLKLIGVYPDGIGFGNISVRAGESASFIITGSATGQFTNLEQANYALVSGFSFEKNTLSCIGLTRASAESLTHAAVYESLPEVGAVVHVHCLWLWKILQHKLPTTSSAIEYGTPKMAKAIGQLVSGIKKSDKKVVVMGGHREGILSFGADLEEATSEIINIFNRYNYD